MNQHNKKNRRVVIKLSGSIFDIHDSMESIDILRRYAEVLIDLTNTIQPIVITGGGNIARLYIKLARNLGLDEASLDLIGIGVSRLNAKLLIAAIGDYAYPNVPESLPDICSFIESSKIIVSGGLHPGQSTNATSSLIAEKTKAPEFINATDVDGIYDSDPKKNSNAQLFKQIKLGECINILLKGSSMAGEYDLMDIVSLKVIERSKINTKVILSTPENIKNAIQGKIYRGTEIIL